MSRETDIARIFVQLADSLVDDFDVVEHLTTLAVGCVDVLDVSAAGLMLADEAGGLRVVASSSEAMRVVELFELQSQEGPCLDCFRSEMPVLNEHFGEAESRWPHFEAFALAAGFHSVHALPMRLRGEVIGALNLFRSDRGPLEEGDVLSAQAFADVATISILHHRADLESGQVREQLSKALTSRVLIEQAKGVVAERAGIGMEAAFARMRNHARSHHLKLADFAQDVINGTVPIPAPV
jgi:GAF domain-containing protein